MRKRIRPLSGSGNQALPWVTFLIVQRIQRAFLQVKSFPHVFCVWPSLPRFVQLFRKQVQPPGIIYSLTASSARVLGICIAVCVASLDSYTLSSGKLTSGTSRIL